MPATRRIVLARRPRGSPVPEDFRLETVDLPAPGAGDVLVRTLWLSLDPYMRGRMSEAPSYAPPVAIGAVMEGETVGVVVAGAVADFPPGTVVRGRGGWQDHAVLPAAGLARVDPELAPVSTALGVLGMPGLTAYAGIEGVGRPAAGETVVVGAATGAVGAVAGQIARLKGARVVGVAGGAEKCAFAVRDLGFDACLDRKAPDLMERLAAACPEGIDVYVELTGGAVTDAALPLLNLHARVPVIGAIAHYNASGPWAGPDRLPWLFRQVLVRRLTVQGVLVLDWEHRRADFLREVGRWVREGAVRYKEDVVEGLEQAPAAFQGLLEGRNFGKLLVRVGPA